jgi:acyl carrier protein
MDWSRHAAQRAGSGVPPLLTEVAGALAREPARKGRLEELSQKLAALAGSDREQAAREYVNGLVAQTLGYPPHHPLDHKRGLFDLGFDSLMAMEFRRRLSADLGRPFPATLVFDHPSIQALAAHLLARVFASGEAVASPQAPARSTTPSEPVPGTDLTAAEIAKLSEAEVASQIRAIFDSLYPPPPRR